MTMTTNATQDTLTNLTDLVTGLTKRVENLTVRLETLEKNKFTDQDPLPAPYDLSSTSQEAPSFEIGSQINKSSILVNLSSTCFILVIALALRTLTDSGMVSYHIGSFIGVGYAAVLIATGWKRLSRKNNVAVIFPISGALLMYSIVLESHVRFEAFNALTSYTVLLLTMITLVITGKRFERSSFYSVGLLGACVTALMIDFPRPMFYQLAFLIFSANVTAFYFSDQPKSRWVQVTLYVMSMLFWIVWASKIFIPLSKGIDVAAGVSTAWFLPVTLLFACTILAFTFHRAFRQGYSMGAFNIIIPTVNAAFLYMLCYTVSIPLLGQGQWVGMAGVFMAAIHYGAAWGIFRFSREGGPGICAFAFAGSILLLLATPSAVNNIHVVLPFLSVVALGLLMTSHACEIGGIRLASYLMQSLTCGMAIGYGVFSPGTSEPVAGILVAASLTLTSSAHYLLSRNRPLSCSSGFFAAVDPSDRSAVFLLLTALISSYCMLQIGGYILLASFSDSIHNAFMGLQSTLINIGAILLMITGLRLKHRELLYTSIAVAVIGALKVFGFDLFNAHGIPLVISVFSLGAVAAVGSIVLGRWPQTEKTYSAAMVQ